MSDDAFISYEYNSVYIVGTRIALECFSRRVSETICTNVISFRLFNR